MPDLKQAKRFLKWMHGPAAALGHQVVVWFNPSKATIVSKTTDKAAAAAVKRTAKKKNAYVCMGQYKAPPEHGRGLASGVTAIGGLWADVDFGPPGEFHTKGNLPPDEKAALNLLTHIGAEPSVITHSGHGLQAFWLFDKPLIFEDDPSRANAAKLSKCWVDTIRAIAKKFGWTTDAVHDLSRVMRIPGTTNWKGTPVDARILSPTTGEPKRWTVEELSALAVPEGLGPSATDRKHAKAAVTQVDPVIPHASGATPAAVTALVQNDTTFKKTWERKRTDHTEWSANEYDLSIASMLVQAGCDDQVIADAIYARRLLHNETPKKVYKHRTYVMLTISRARTNQESDGALNIVATMTDAPKAASPEEETDERALALDKLGKALRVNIVRIVKHGQENSVYSLELSDGEGVKDVHVGNINAMLEQRRFKAALADATGVVIRRIKQDRWDKVSELMLRVAFLVKNEESTRINTIIGWLRAYVVEGRSMLFHGGDNEWTRAFVNNDPFVHEGRLGIHVATFRRFLRFQEPDKIDRATIFHLLRVAGFVPERITVRTDDRRLCRSYWVGPASILDADELDIDPDILRPRSSPLDPDGPEGPK